MDDFVVNVRQITQYPQKAAASPTDAVLLQTGGLGGPYAWVTPDALLAPLATERFAVGGIDIAGSINWLGVGAELFADGSGWSFLWGGQPVALVRPDGGAFFGSDVQVQGRITAFQPLEPNEVATAQYVTDNTVWTFNGRRGNIQLTAWDVAALGFATTDNPHFTGRPTTPDVIDPRDSSAIIANTRFVQSAITQSTWDLLSKQPFVFTFQGRKGDVCLRTDDVNRAYFFADGVSPVAPTPPWSDNTDKIANTRWVGFHIADLTNSMQALEIKVDEKIDLNNYATLGYISANYAPINDATLTGHPSAPTAPVGTNTGQIATTAFVMAQVEAATAGVASFNGRTGNVSFEAQDIVDVGGALLASPHFTGIPTAPTATPNDSSTQLATTAFVMGELSAIDSGVVTWNGRSGFVTMQWSDVAGVGGAPLASPAFTGVPTADTAAPGTATGQLATTGFVAAALNALPAHVLSFNGRTGAVVLNQNDISAVGGALLAGPAFSGIPTAPTAAVGTNTTQLATTAFVQQSGANVPAVRYDQAQSLTLTQRQQARQNIYAASFDAMAAVNLAINSSMEISQENMANSVPLSSGVNSYTVDMWRARVVNTPSSFAVQQVTTAPPGFKNSIQLSNGSPGTGALGANDMVLLGTAIEGNRLARLGWGTPNADPLTIAFLVDPTMPGPITGTVSVQNATQNRSYCANFVSQQFIWNLVVVTIPGDTVGVWPNSNSTGAFLWICFGAGSNSNQGVNGAWVNGAQFATPQTSNWFATASTAALVSGFVALEGNEAPTVDRIRAMMRPYQEELALCRRYYRIRRAAGAGEAISLMQVFSANQFTGTVWQWEGNEMMRQPLAGYSGAADFAIYDPGTASHAVTGFAAFQSYSNVIYVTGSVAGGLTPGMPGLLTFNAGPSANMRLDARM